MAFQPTNNQRQVMDAKGSNQIVSASAGSGKTTVMIELIAERVISRQIDLADILLITFTNSATNDMKQKLANKIQSLMQTDTSTYLKKQYDKVANCKISTIDKLCQDIVKQYFYAIDISPNFNVLSKEDMLLIRDKAFDKVLDNYIEAGNNEVMDLCLMLLKKRSQQTLKSLVYKFYDFLRVQSSEADFIAKVKEVVSLPLDSNKVICFYNQQLADYNNSTIAKLNSLRTFVTSQKLLDYVDNTLNIIGKIKDVFCLDLFDYVDKTPSAKEDKEIQKQIASLVKTYKANIGKIKSSVQTTDAVLLEKVISSVAKMLDTLIEFTLAFDAEYIKLKRENNSYEFNDIEHFALKILNISQFRDAIKSEIKHIFVDEYQDVNELQDAIVSKLASEDNLFMVGDMKQSIYAFRLCAPHIFINKFYTYMNEGGGQAHILNENFRSNPRILSFVNDVFEIAMTKESCGIDYKSDGAFAITSNDNNELLRPVNIHLIDNKKAKAEMPSEIYSVANDSGEVGMKDYMLECNEILHIIHNALSSQIYDKSISALRDVKYSDIAILFRNRSKLYYHLGQKLTSLGISVNMDFKIDIFDSYIAKFINSALRLVFCINDDISLATVMRFAGFDFTDAEIFEIANTDPKETFCEAVLNYEGELRPKIDKMLAFFDNLRKKSIHSRVTDIIYEIDEYIGLQNILLSKEQGANELITFTRLVDYVASLNYDNSLVEYLLYLDKLDESKEAVVMAGDENGINITTIHSSKGLEYPIVILADAGTPFKDKTRSEPIVFHKDGIGTFYFDLAKNFKMPSPMYNYFANLKHKEEINEELRLLYVALTRPKNILYVTACVNMETLQKDGKLNSNCYAKYILDGVNDLALGSFLTAGEYSDEWLSICKSSENVSLDMVQNTPTENNILKNELIKRINFKYAHNSSNISYKTSVTEIASQESPHTYTSSNIQKLLITEDEFEMNEIGTLYHKVFELVDFDEVNTIQDVSDYIQKLPLDDSERDVIDPMLIFAFKDALSQFDIKDIQKEKRFLLKVPYKDLVETSGIEDEVIVQGVIDLIITDKDDKHYLVDYKLTSASEKEAVVRYKKQLEIYAKSVSLATGQAVSGAYIYLIRQKYLVKVF